MNTIILAQIATGITAILAIRTLLFWLQQWQIREYRLDRLWDHIWRSDEGRKKLWNIWFFKGILPRPKFSARMILVLGMSLLLAAGFNIGLWTLIYDPLLLNKCIFNPQDYESVLGHINCAVRGHPELNTFFTLLLTERFLWLITALSVFGVKPLVNIQQRKLFQRAHHIINTADKKIIRIGLSGSFGKSSTKELLVHILVAEYGADNVLYNPENNNNEVAIAQLIVRNKAWFANTDQQKKVLVIETGAYTRGEVDLVCDIIQPSIGIITGLNTQHLSLFGSVENVKLAETELAHKTSKKVFYNAQSPLLADAMSEQFFKNVQKPITYNNAKSIHSDIDKTSFTWEQQEIVLPWAGKFFVLNALLALEVAKEIGIKNPGQHVPSLPPLKRALSISTHEQGFTLLNDPYSANPDGVLAAIEHMSRFKGRKIFVGIPLIELGKESVLEHTKIFKALQSVNAEVFWLKSDHSLLGQTIVSDAWKGADLVKLKQTFSELKDEDVVLLESRLPKGLLH